MLLVAFGGFCLAEPSPPTASDLARLVFQYFDTDDADKADRLLQTILSRKDVSVKSVSHVLHNERVFAIRPVGRLPHEEITVQGYAYRLAMHVPPTYRPSRRYGLVVCLHGAGFTGEEYLDRWLPRLDDNYLLVCPTYPGGAWFTRHAEALVIATIRHVAREYDIDPDRIFLTGMSNGGIGAWLIGMHHAPLFAGIAPMASGLDAVLMPFLENLRNTPIYIVHGEKDQVMPVELSRSISRKLDALGYPYVYREHQGEHPMAGGHYFPREELPELVKWFNSRRREAPPMRITVVRDASHFQPFDWLRMEVTDPIAVFSENLVDKRDERIKRREFARLDARIMGTNRIEVTAERVRRYTLFLNEQLIDPSKPIVVLTNGQMSFKGVALPSVETLLRQARLRQDSHRLFSIQLRIIVKQQRS